MAYTEGAKGAIPPPPNGSDYEHDVYSVRVCACFEMAPLVVQLMCYHKLNQLSLEMNEYFVIIAYSNNVYFSAILGNHKSVSQCCA